jgi:glucose-1-phosphate cytidylyltransferase
MKTLILCGGKNERLRFQGEDQPKPLWKIGGKPLVWHIMQHYARFGYNDFILCTGARHEAFEKYVFEESDPRFNITLSNAGPETGTSGRILHAASLINTEPFLCTYGDGLSDIDINALLRSHKNAGTIATLTAVRPRLTFGLLDITPQNKVVKFDEKPKLEAWINGGYFVFESAALSYFRLGEVLEREPLTALSDAGQLNAFRHEGNWQCMDTFKDYQLLQELASLGRAFW